MLRKTSRAEGSAGKRTYGPEKRQLAEVGQQNTLALPKRGSPVHTLIGFLLRLDEEVAGKAVFVEEDAPDGIEGLRNLAKIA